MAQSTHIHPKETADIIVVTPMPESDWSNDNLPNELFRLDPPASFSANRPYNKFGESWYGPSCLEYPFLPSQISARCEPWRLEMYADRLDGRVRYHDIVLRMYSDLDFMVPSEHTMISTLARFRREFELLEWSGRSAVPSVLELLVVERYSPLSVSLNTTLPATPQGLLKPRYPRRSDSKPVVIPRNTFLNPHEPQAPHAPSQRMRRCLDQISKLRDEAARQHLVHWVFLANRFKPAEWLVMPDSYHFGRTGPENVTFPPVTSFPIAALKIVKQAIVDAVAGRTNLEVPLPQWMPQHCRKWMEICLEEGLALASVHRIDTMPPGLLKWADKPEWSNSDGEGCEEDGEDS